MKLKIFATLIIVASVFSTEAYAQRNTYGELKYQYNYKNYVPQLGDPYSPGVAGVASFFVPGLGQMVSGETRRGLAFLGGAVGFGIIYGVGTAKMAQYYDPYTGTFSDDVEGQGAVVVGAVGILAVGIWSIVDAVRVAKVKNMAFQERNAGIFKDISIQPGVTAVNGEMNVGAGIKLRF